MINKVYTYKPGSKSGKAIAAALGVKRLKHQGSRWRPRASSCVLNWGATSMPDLSPAFIINPPDRVRNASDKRESFALMAAAGVPTPDFTDDRATASRWAQEHVVFCRTLTRANSGRGIVVAENPGEVIPAPLYTKYFKRQDEYRVHIVGQECIDFQRKMRSRSVPDDQVNWKIRSHNNGFVFGRGDVQLPECVLNAAVAAMYALRLDFGAVDIGYNQHYDKAVVFEVNTAPGLEGTTLEKYVQALTAFSS